MRVSTHLHAPVLPLPCVCSFGAALVPFYGDLATKPKHHPVTKAMDRLTVQIFNSEVRRGQWGGFCVGVGFGWRRMSRDHRQADSGVSGALPSVQEATLRLVQHAALLDQLLLEFQRLVAQFADPATGTVTGESPDLKGM